MSREDSINTNESDDSAQDEATEIELLRRLADECSQYHVDAVRLDESSVLREQVEELRAERDFLRRMLAAAISGSDTQGSE